MNTQNDDNEEAAETELYRKIDEMGNEKALNQKLRIIHAICCRLSTNPIPTSLDKTRRNKRQISHLIPSEAFIPNFPHEPHTFFPSILSSNCTPAEKRK